MDIYSDYLNTIRDAMVLDPKGGLTSDSFSGENRHFSKGLSYEMFNKKIPEKMLQPGLAQFANQLGRSPDFTQKLGMHPDFSHLKGTSNIENHYIVSMFVDIKGSTNLFRRYTPQTVLVIVNTIQRAAIHTCLIFGGYVHRLQGDGLFVYFGGKNIAISDAVQNSLQFGSVFTNFVKEDLKKLFNEQGIETIFTRIGIDLGHNQDVIWASAGLGEICEITTCSLHTSLAPKMQAHAHSNGIVVGANIVPQSLLFEGLFQPVCRRTNNENDRYIYQNADKGLNYTQYDFDWLGYLKRQSFIATDLNGNLQLKIKNPQLSLSRDLAPIAIVSKPYCN